MLTTSDVSTYPKAVLLYVPAIAIAELMALFAGGVASGVAHGLLFCVLLNHYRAVAGQRYAFILLGLALPSLLRLLTLVLAFPTVSPLLWYGLVAIPMLFVIGWVVHQYGWRATRLTAGIVPLRYHLLFGATGILLSPLAYFVLRPIPAQDFNSLEYTRAAIGIFVMAGGVEEILFRGLLQQAAIKLYGRVGLWWSTTLFAVMYVGYLSIQTLIFFYLVGMIFAWWAEMTKSVWGGILAHGAMMIGALLILPAIF